MSDTFYPFVDNADNGLGHDVEPPSYAARIAVYDAMTVPPRVITVPPSDVRTYLDEITKNVWELATQQGGEWPFHIIRELVENYIHASFKEPTISIMDRGQTISFSDQGPGIPNKEAALRPTFSSATTAMKRYIRGTGSGLPMVEAQVKLQHGSISIEDNLNGGVVVTVSLADKNSAAPTQDARQTNQPSAYVQPNTQAGMTFYPAQPAAMGYPQQQMPMQGYPQQPIPYPSYGTYGMQSPQTGYQNPYAYGIAQERPVYPTYPQAQPQQYQGVDPYAQAPRTDATPQPAQGCGTVLSTESKHIVSLFARYDKIGSTEVSEELGISKSTGTRRLKDLCESGLVVKTGQKYVLTEEGKQALSLIASKE